MESLIPGQASISQGAGFLTELAVGGPPDPLTAAAPDEFLARLRELREWAGNPALRRLRQLAGTAVGHADDRVNALPASTISHVLRGDRLPRFEFVRGFVAACLRARGRDPDEIAEQVERWHASWLRLSRPATPPDSPPGSAASARAPRPVPRQLPAEVSGLTGRAEELARLATVGAAADRDESVVIWTIDGPPGVGKSALAVHAAHRLAEGFPDGQLYVDLQEAAAGLSPLEPVEVLGRFLRALGVADVPDGAGEAAARFRSELAGRRVLLLLDNATDEAQVRPLLPGTAGCAVLITARRPLPGLAAAGHLHLDVLSEPDAVRLLGSLIGDDRGVAEPCAAAEVARWCGHLPLALRIAGARLAARSGWPVAALAERLADQQRRLDELQVAQIGVRASFDVSYRALCRSGDPTDQAAAQAFALLGTWDGPELRTPVAARLLDRPETECERLLERLVDAGLLDTPSPGRYRLHDLLRLYAREYAARSYSESERSAALGRVLDCYVATAWPTLALLRPTDRRLSRVPERWRTDLATAHPPPPPGLEFPDGNAAVTWLEEERPNLLTAIAQAATNDPLAPAAIQLAQALFGFFLAAGFWRDCVQANRAVLEVAGRAGDLAAQAQAHSDIAGAHHLRGQYEDALPHVQKSIELYRSLDDRQGYAASLANLGAVYTNLGPPSNAVAALRESLAIREELGDRAGCACTLNNLGLAHLQQGDPERARRCLDRALETHRSLGNGWGEATCLDSLGMVLHAQQEYAEAIGYYRRSLAVRRQLDGNHHFLEAETLRHIGESLRALGRADEANRHWYEALEIYDQLRVPYADDLRGLLATGAQS